MANAQAQAAAGEVEPYKLSEIFSIVPEYDGNPISLLTFINSCDMAYGMSVDDQRLLLILHIKNKLRGRASELINSRNPNTWAEIKSLLETHFGDQRDLTSLIADLSRIKQLPNESPLTFVSRLQSHNAKMHSAIHKQTMTNDQKLAQSNLIETMVLNTLLTGLEPKIGQVVRSSYPPDILTAIMRIKRELQLSYFQEQKTPINRNQPSVTRRPMQSNFTKNCTFCRKSGHNINECRIRQNTQTPPYVQQRNFPPQNNNPGSSQPYNNQRPVPNGQPQNRPPVIRPNPNFQRPSAIQPNTNYQRSPNTSTNPNFQNSKTHHINSDFPAGSNYDYYSQPDNYDYNETYQETTQTDYDHPYEEDNYNYAYDTPSTSQENPNLDFQNTLMEEKPPYNHVTEQIMYQLESQIQTMNLDNYDPTLNFPEQQFL